MLVGVSMQLVRVYLGDGGFLEVAARSGGLTGAFALAAQSGSMQPIHGLFSLLLCTL
jgi:hypothetical protein